MNTIMFEPELNDMSSYHRQSGRREPEKPRPAPGFEPSTLTFRLLIIWLAQSSSLRLFVSLWLTQIVPDVCNILRMQSVRNCMTGRAQNESLNITMFNLRA